MKWVSSVPLTTSKFFLSYSIILYSFDMVKGFKCVKGNKLVELSHN